MLARKDQSAHKWLPLHARGHTQNVTLKEKGKARNEPWNCWREKEESIKGKGASPRLHTRDRALGRALPAREASLNSSPPYGLCSGWNMSLKSKVEDWSSLFQDPVCVPKGWIVTVFKSLKIILYMIKPLFYITSLLLIDICVFPTLSTINAVTNVLVGA